MIHYLVTHQLEIPVTRERGREEERGSVSVSIMLLVMYIPLQVSEYLAYIHLISGTLLTTDPFSVDDINILTIVLNKH